MAEINNFSEITENFDTIKTLLNSIRAQGILNTSDVDKLLAGINSKLEKINTEEDIDLIKIFLSELKQNLDERHNVLISKFGAIESLFSNLLKNSADTLKSSEVKELFDIVATNLSVFSREVVSQKETLTDITLRLDAMRSDDSQKKEIIKSISLLKNDLEHLGNGFDSIVLSLNENFKTLIKTLSNVDQSEAINKFGGQLDDIVNSSNTILSALQMMDKKNDQLEGALKGLASQDDVIGAKKWLSDLVAKNHELNDSINNLSDKYYKIDNLAEKIDASVSIIAGLKTVISESESQNSEKIMNELEALQTSLKEVTTNQSFEEFKASLEIVLKDISSGSINLQNSLVDASSEIQKISTNLQALDINVNFQSLMSNLEKMEHDIKEHTDVVTDKISQLVEVNATRTLNEISNNADSLISKLKDSHYTMTKLCEKSFNDVADDIANLKTVVSQIDENNVSANNAIFSNVTDRLAIFENSLKSSLEKQEDYVANSSSQLFEQIKNIKELSGVIDYKLDASVIEVNNSKREFAELKSAVQDVLGLDFVNAVKDLRVDLYAVKQDLATAFENSTTEQAEKSANDLFGKYELLVSKLDSVEDTLKQAQTSALNALKPILDNISSSIMDVISYVSSQKELNTDSIDVKLANITEIVKDSNLNYVENVRDVVEVIRTQVENNLIQIQKENSNKIDSINTAISKNTESLKEEIKYSYNKLLEVQDNFDEIKEALNVNNITLSTNIGDIISSTDGLKSDFEVKLSTLKNSLLDKISDFKQEFTCENADKISEIKFTTENLHAKSLQNSQELIGQFKGEIAQIIGTLRLNVEELAEQLSSTTLKVEGGNREVVNFIKNDFCAEVDNSVNTLKSDLSEFSSDMQNYTDKITGGFDDLKNSVDLMSEKTNSSLTSTLAKILDNFVSLKGILNSFNETNMQNFKDSVDSITEDFANLKDRLENVDKNVDEDLTRQFNLIETNFEELSNSIAELFSRSDNELSFKIENGLVDISARIDETVASNLEQYKAKIESLFDDIVKKNDEQADYIKERVLGLNEALEATLAIQNENAENRLKNIADEMKIIIDDNIEVTSADYDSLKAKLADFTLEMSSLNKTLSSNLKHQLDDIAKCIDSGLEVQASNIESKFDEITNKTQLIDVKLNEVDESVLENINDLSCKFEHLKAEINEISQNLTNTFKQDVSENLTNGIEGLYEKMQSLFETISLNFTTHLDNENSKILEDLTAKTVEFKAAFETLNDRLDKDEISQMNVFQAHIKELSGTFSTLIEEAKNVTKSEVSTISKTLIDNSKDLFNGVEQTIEDKLTNILTATADISADELQSMEAFTNQILKQVEVNKQNVISCRDLIVELVQKECELVSEDIEKETDVIVKDIIEQFNLFKGIQKDELDKLTVHVESSIEDYIFNYVNELKSYLDIKTDSTVMNQKLDNIQSELNNTVDDMLSTMNKFLEASVFSSAMSDLRTANEILVSSTADKLNKQINDFVLENVTNKLDDKLNLFDKKFTDTIVDKYEEIKMISSQYNQSFENIKTSVGEILDEFKSTKNEINATMQTIMDGISNSINSLNVSFADLKEQILNKSFDEVFQASLNNQISGIENLVKEQFGYLEDISDLCCNNLPELTEMNTLVKYGIQQSIKDLANKVDAQDISLNEEISKLKSDIITQFLNIFNQISFVAEQEEILDFIQEKHSELITILSHIVTTIDNVDTVKDNVAVVDNKIDSLKEDIDLINEKITSIISSDGDIDYVYSLQDLESDIANLRLVLNEMKSGNNSKELEELVTSTNDIYKLVESLKTEMPKFEYDEFKKDFETLSEDIVSISTRTNKLILASDESHKCLQDNLQEFKLVINDLDERTRNFAHEAGIDRLDNKLGAINSMIQSGAKTNQVFNQVFEYLAEWVDKAGEQITTISDKVETLDDIGQIKVMLEDLKAEAEDNTESTELIEALSNVFEKQAKRISSLEAKLDRVIVETTISNKNSKIDMTPFENTLNSFLVAIDDKMSSQQDKINSLESKLEEVMTKIDPKDTAQLTKKVGGMDRQIAKLNKSIEKIASHVVEK